MTDRYFAIQRKDDGTPYRLRDGVLWYRPGSQNWVRSSIQGEQIPKLVSEHMLFELTEEEVAQNVLTGRWKL